MSEVEYYRDDTPCLTVWVEGGIVRMVTNIPPGLTVRVVDEERDGIDPSDDPKAEFVNGRPAVVSYWTAREA